MTHTDLKPCPFCGGKAAFLNTLYPPRVLCTFCEVIGPAVFPRNVVDLWNTRTLDTAPSKPFCETCGKNVGEVLCPTCAKWWANNPPTAPGQSADLIAEAERWFDDPTGDEDALVSDTIAYKLITALRAAEAENAKLREALTSIARSACCDTCQEAALVARDALGGPDAQR